MEISCYGNHFASLSQILTKYVRGRLHAKLYFKMVAERIMTPVTCRVFRLTESVSLLPAWSRSKLIIHVTSPAEVGMCPSNAA